jgi:hypothetical protein
MPVRDALLGQGLGFAAAFMLEEMLDEVMPGQSGDQDGRDLSVLSACPAGKTIAHKVCSEGAG